MSHVSITGATYGVVTRDGSCLRHGSQTRTHVGGGKTGEAAGKVEPGQAGPLVPNECCGSERASLGLPPGGGALGAPLHCVQEVQGI